MKENPCKADKVIALILIAGLILPYPGYTPQAVAQDVNDVQNSESPEDLRAIDASYVTHSSNGSDENAGNPLGSAQAMTEEEAYAPGQLIIKTRGETNEWKQELDYKGQENLPKNDIIIVSLS